MYIRHSHEGNIAITFYNPSTQARTTGFIEKNWRLPLEGSMQSFVVVRPHRRLSAIEEEMAPFPHYPGFMLQIVDAHATDGPVIIEPHHTVTHLTTFQRRREPIVIQGKHSSFVKQWSLVRKY
jgi:hypothetical protein